MPQGSRGRVTAWEDFTGAIAQTLSDATEYVSPSGEWRMAAISGNVAMTIETDEPNGVASFSGAGGAADGVGFFAMPYQPSTQGTVAVEFRWQTDAITSYGFFAGLAETVAVAEPVNPFTLSGTTLTSNNTGQTWGIYFDTAATTDDVRAMASSDGTEFTAALDDEGNSFGTLGIRANVTVAAGSYMVARIILEPDGRGEAWFGIGSDTGPKKFASIRAGSLDQTAFYHPLLLLVDPSTNDPLHSVDFLLAEGGRSWAA